MSKYVKLDHKEHVLRRSETYVGSKVTEKNKMYVLPSLKDLKVIKKEVDYNPAFIKIFDEIIVNSSDQAIRTGDVTYIRVKISNDKISVENDGPTVPIELHPTENVYNPELIFAHLLTGENYDDSKERIVGGRNGLGAKLTNIFSKKFMIECSDGVQRYRQTIKKNMTEIQKPIIDKASSDKAYTKITYYPDYDQFDFDSLSDDILSIMYKRCLDIAVYNPKVRVSVDGKTLPVKSIRDWMKMHLDDDSEFFYEKLDNEWEVGISKSTGHGFEQTSIVNGITTHRGGTHVNYMSLQLSKDVADKLPKSAKASWMDVKNKLFLFLVSKVPNPTFDTQTKENLTNSMTNTITGGQKVSEKIVKKIVKSEIVRSVLEEMEMREKLALKRLGGGKKRTINLEKLVDANKAGTRDSNKCYLFLCEGDSAVSMAISGMSVVGRDYYGAFPLRGKVLNVRDASLTKIKNNNEIQNLINIIGLTFGENYEDTSDLRYGKIVLMTDADVDGIHIKGLLLNFFENNWPELLKMDFLYEFITPVLKAKKGKEIKSFYTLRDYNNWLSHNPKGWTIKYYKGLGTSTPKESKEYFKDLNNHLLPFTWDTDQNSDYIDMVFRSKRSDERKDWMLNTEPENVEKYETPTPISSFINNEMITFSLSDNIRSIPDLYDGLKPSQRKILHTCLKRNLTNEVPVSSLAGSIKENTKYHHGEVSLEQGVVNLAQDYVGSNNIPLLVPAGSFGTRLQGGKDAASSRYIHTHLQPITKLIFDNRDNSILNYLEEDGYTIEPDKFRPVLPMALINGTEGIGTGWSTFIPKYNPKDIIRVIENKLNSKRSNKIHPHYNGFRGDIIEDEKGNYVTYGKFDKINTTTLHISELPIGTWTQDFITLLHKLIESKFIKEFTDNSTEESVDITISMSRESMIKMSNDTELIKKFKLSSTLYMSNMNLFLDGKITKFNSVMDIIDVYFKKRLDDYESRKKEMLEKIKTDQTKLDNQVRFILMVIKGELKINNRKKDLIETDLIKKKFDKIDDSFNYLLSMAIYSLTKEKVDELSAQAKNKQNEFKTLKRTKHQDLWLKDLEEIKKLI